MRFWVAAKELEKQVPIAAIALPIPGDIIPNSWLFVHSSHYL